VLGQGILLLKTSSEEVESNIKVLLIQNNEMKNPINETFNGITPPARIFDPESLKAGPINSLPVFRKELLF
jgi:hypothetical protein